jgi:acetyl esterase/lipase
MIAKQFDMEESDLYEKMTNEDVIAFAKRNEELDPSVTNHRYHTNQELYNHNEEVMIRLLYNQPLGIDFQLRYVERTKEMTRVSKIIIHFHGGGFLCHDSASH